MTKHDIHPTQAVDIPALAEVVEATGLFPPEMLPEMVQAHLDGTEEALWLMAVLDGRAVGLAYSRIEPLTEGTWNLLALAVLPSLQGGGIGRTLVAETEVRLRSAGHRLVLVDTSGTEDFAQTRRFYAGLGYEVEARIRDYWAAGDDKVTYRKALT